MIKEVGHSEQGTDDEGSLTNAEVLGEKQWEDIVCVSGRVACLILEKLKILVTG